MAKSCITVMGVITGYGTIMVDCLCFFGFYRFGGALSETHAEKICKVMDMAVKMGTYDRTKRFRWRTYSRRVRSLGYADIFIETYKQVA
jgi:propionyl-CoA carboxylase beta chain